jgi:hypothetical protein
MVKSLFSDSRVRVSLAILAMVAAGWAMFSASDAGRTLPDSAQDAVLYVCTVEGSSFSLTPKALAEARSRVGGPIGFVPCPTCNKPVGVRAIVVNGKAVPQPGMRRDEDLSVVPASSGT